MASWQDILSNERVGEEISIKGARKAEPVRDGESKAKEFIFSNMQRDPNLIIFSSAFRRMQRKAQVYLSPTHDFVRNRLTHTLEVVSIGEILAHRILQKLELDDDEFLSAKVSKGLSKRDFVESIAAACYAHDIGNPPFGHIGEYAIGAWFREKKGVLNRGDTVSATHAELEKIFREKPNVSFDFENFDGNPQGFRLITKLQGWKNKGGLKLTFTTLATFCKYINFSGEGIKKYGCFHSEKSIFQKVFEGLKLQKDGRYFRHPFSYIMEAADDIAYCCSDIEDGIKMRLIPRDEGIKKLKAIAKTRMDNLGKTEILNSIHEQSSDYIKYLRSAATESLIYSCYSAFFSESADGGRLNYQLMLDGDFEDTLIGVSDQAKVYEDAKKLSMRYVYGSKHKISREQGAYQIVRFYLGVFSDAIEKFHSVGKKIDLLDPRSRNTLMILHRIYDNEELVSAKSDFRSIRQLRACDGEAHYRMLIDFVSGMTDDYAISLADVMRGTNMEAL